MAHSLLPLQYDVRIETGYRSEKTDGKRPYNVFEGNGLQRRYLNASGYRLDSTGTVVGGIADYTFQERRNTGWSNVADTELFYPYLVADSVGGNYFSETYRVGGFYGKTLNKLLLGGRFDYRGAVYYRKVDPRPRNDVSEMKFSVGAVYPLNEYRVGAYLSYTNYYQQIGISVLKSDRKDRFFSMNGLGLFDYSLSATESNYSRYFSLNEWQSGLHFSHIDNKNWAAMVTFSQQYVDEKDDSERKPYEIVRTKAAASISYQFQPTSKHYVQIEAGAKIISASGTENHYDTVFVHRDPDIIAYEKNYSAVKHNLSDWSGQAAVIYEYKSTLNQRFWGKIQGQYRTYSENYVYPKYVMDYSQIQIDAEVGIGHCFFKSIVNWMLLGGKMLPKQAKLLVPPENPVVREMVYPQFQYFTTGYTHLGTSINYHRVVSQSAAIRIGALTQMYINQIKRFNHTISLSLIF